MIRRTFLLALPVLAAACGPLPPVEMASLPPDAVVGAGDPTRAAAAQLGSAFEPSGRMRGTLAQQARTIGNLEYLAVNAVNNPLLPNAPATLQSQLRDGRAEWRQALGIPADAPAQQVVNQFYAASRALEMGAAPPVSLAALQARPALPRSAAAAALAAEAIRPRNEERPPR